MTDPDKTLDERRTAVAQMLQDYLTNEGRKIGWLAEKSGIHRTTVSRIVNGHILPEPETCRQLSRATGIPVENLMVVAGYLTAEWMNNRVNERAERDERDERPETRRAPMPAISDVNISDPELAFHLRQIGDLEPEDIQFFKEFLREEIRVRQLLRDAGLSQIRRPPFARQLHRDNTNKE